MVAKLAHAHIAAVCAGGCAWDRDGKRYSHLVGGRHLRTQRSPDWNAALDAPEETRKCSEPCSPGNGGSSSGSYSGWYSMGTSRSISAGMECHCQQRKWFRVYINCARSNITTNDFSSILYG